MAGKTIGEQLQDILSRGLDVGTAVVLDRLHVNDPAGQVTGPSGNTARVGQPAGSSGVAGAVAAVPPWVWIAGAGALVLVLLLRK